MNAYYEALSQDAFSLSVFGGLSHVWAEGEIKDQAWSQSAFGQQLGLKAYFLKGSAAQPYAGLRVLHYQIEQNSSTINLYNWGLVLGARF
jgi:hypothetical protein